jgi:hypothetical protein
MQQRTASQASSKAIWTWEMLGVAFIVVAGSCLHFVYGWLGGAAAVALVAARKRVHMGTSKAGLLARVLVGSAGKLATPYPS